MGKDAILHAGEKHGVEFQALRGVQSHEGYHALPLFPVRHLIGVSDQSDPLQEGGQRGIGLGHSRRQPGFALLVEIDDVRSRHELCRHVDQLLQILQARLVLGIGGVLQLREVPGVGEHRGEDLVSGIALGHFHAVPLDQVHKTADLFHRTGRKTRRLLAAREGIEEADAFRAGQRRERRHGPVTNAAFGNVEDPPHRHVIGGVGDGPEVGDGVADLPAFVEPHPADHPVGHPDADEHLLERPGLGVGPVEHRDVAVAGTAVVDEPVDLPRHELRLVVFGVGNPADDRGAIPQVAPQRLVAASPVPGDHRVRGLEHGVGGAVVLVQHDRPGAREVVLEIENVADRRPPEGVDGLVRVAHHHQLGRFHRRRPRGRRGGLSAEFADQRVLGVVGVLVLVHQHVAEPSAVLLADLGERLEQVHGGHDQVVEVEGVGGPQPRLVVLVDLGVGLLHRAGGLLLRGLEVHQVVLPAADGVHHRAHRESFRIELLVPHHQRHQALGVGVVIDGEGPGDTEAVDLGTQDAHAGRVEGGDPH